MSDPDRGKSDRFQWSAEEAQKPEATAVLVPEMQSDGHSRLRESRLEEAVGLAEAISLDVKHSGTISLKRIVPATLFGSGKVEEISGIIKSLGIGLVVVDHPVSPGQQQNLEKAWNCKVLDRTALILEIFGARAKTREGRLQVELAHLNYQKGRLVRSWTHLERQRGGLGFIGGPGETQIEADRRMIRERISRLEKELEKVRKTRSLHRAGRKKVPHPVVALVGYTNAGKSTLFNALTGASVAAKDQLFATLDPTLRTLQLKNGATILLSDTVGFVSGLPTHLIAAFRATLEEVVEADLILHVRDIAHADTQEMAKDVYSVLSQLGIDQESAGHITEVWNKIDLLDSDALESMELVTRNNGEILLVSAEKVEGLEALSEHIQQKIEKLNKTYQFVLPVDVLGKLSWFYKNTQVIDRTDQENGSVHLKVMTQGVIPASLKKYLA